MKTEYHLVLTSNKHTFKNWMYKFMETFGNIPPTNHYNHTKQQLKVFIGDDVYYYLCFTEPFDVTDILGIRVNSVIDPENITSGLSEKTQHHLKVMIRRF